LSAGIAARVFDHFGDPALLIGVEVIDAEGYACLYGYLYLHEAIKISAYFEGEARRGKEPRVYIPPALVSVGLTDD